MKLYYHPISTYSQKVLLAFYESGVHFEPKIVNLSSEERTDYLKIYPMGKIPLLVLNDGYRIPESSVIIEYLDTEVLTSRAFVPNDPVLARKVRFFDRMADLYLNNPLLTLYLESQKEVSQRDEGQQERAFYQLKNLFDLLEDALKKGGWLFGESLTLADFAVIPPLALACEIAPFHDYKNLQLYWENAATLASFRRIQDEAEPYLAGLAAKTKTGPES